MDSGDAQHFSQSDFSDSITNPPAFTTPAFQYAKSSSIIELEKFQSGTNPLNLPQHQVFPNQFRGQYFPQQHYGRAFPYSSFLNPPNVLYAGANSEGANSHASKVPKKKTKKNQKILTQLIVVGLLTKMLLL
ncbi:hypothetical protein OROGR_017151 [Orobanche gracilis]